MHDASVARTRSRETMGVCKPLPKWDARAQKNPKESRGDFLDWVSSGDKSRQPERKNCQPNDALSIFCGRPKKRSQIDRLFGALVVWLDAMLPEGVHLRLPAQPISPPSNINDTARSTRTAWR
jgi:hypothetical protein